MKRQLAALLLTIFALSLTACGETAAESETRTVYAMDTVMNLTVYGENAAAALESAEKELHTLDEAVLSRTAEGSELYALNTSNGETVEYGADDILPALIETARAQGICELKPGIVAGELRVDLTPRGRSMAVDA